MEYIQEFIRYIKFERCYSVHTQKAYECDLNQFNDYLTSEYECTLLDAKDIMVRSWMMFLIEANCTKRSLNRKLSSIRQFYKYALRNDILIVNPTLRVVSLKSDKKIPSFISDSEISFLLEQSSFPESYEGKRDKAIIQMFYNTGMRLSELIALKIDDVNFSQKYLKVYGKRAKERIIPLMDSHLIDLKVFLDLRLREFKGVDNLFLTVSGDKLYPKLVYRMVNSYLSRVTGVKQKSPHVLRHAFATHMLNDGADLNAVKDILGHASLTSTQIYTHNNAEQLKKVYKQAHPRGDK
tara:strand:+ start:128 stop:1012 length:885 start_codon:yes stop_codon:yes gene_type:complete